MYVFMYVCMYVCKYACIFVSKCQSLCQSVNQLLNKWKQVSMNNMYIYILRYWLTTTTSIFVSCNNQTTKLTNHSVHEGQVAWGVRCALNFTLKSADDWFVFRLRSLKSPTPYLFPVSLITGHHVVGWTVKKHRTTLINIFICSNTGYHHHKIMLNTVTSKNNDWLLNGMYWTHININE